VLKFLLRRVASGIVLLGAISIVTYALLYFSSRNIARNILGDSATPEQLVLKEQELGLDRPLPERYLDWLGSALTGDLGRSWFGPESVVAALASRLPVTLLLVLTSILITAMLATLLGLAAAARRGWVDRVIQIGSVVAQAVPGYLLAIALVAVFAIQLHLFPPISTIRPGAPASAWAASLTLPVIAIVANAVIAAAQQIRSAVITQGQRDHVRTLRSRGIGETEILFRHVLRSAAPAGLTVLSLQFVGMLSATVIIEQIFAIPGVGPYAIRATTMGDIPVVMGVVIYTVVIVVVVNLLIDVANGVLNPKVRVS